jgi:sensor histidine kinase YesM
VANRSIASRWRRIRIGGVGYWTLQLLGWGFYFYAQASGEVIFAQMPWSKAGTLWGGVALMGIAFTQLLRLLMQRRGWLSLRPGALLARMAAAAVLISAASYLLTLALSEAVYGTAVAPIAAAFYQRLTVGGQLRNQYLITLMVHVAWIALYLSFAMQRHRYQAEVRHAQLGEALRAAELRLLQSQLNPHFLLNALNGLRSLIADDPARARDAVTQLARTMRYSLASSTEDRVSLERELEMVEDYLALESMRLESRLRIDRHIEPGARAARLPAMLLQTLVENAIKHGIAQLKAGGSLRIGAKIEGSELILEVVNPRPEQAAESASEGVGLRNASQRLRLMFGERASLRLDLSQPGVASAVARLPA